MPPGCGDLLAFAAQPLDEASAGVASADDEPVRHAPSVRGALGCGSGSVHNFHNLPIRLGALGCDAGEHVPPVRRALSAGDATRAS